MSPQFVDFDGDGYTDMVTATFEGTAFLVKGSAEGWQQPEYIVDAQDRPLVLSLFYDMKANKYDNADRSPEGTTNPKDHCTSAMATDWDGDGDFDMLLGAYEGRLYLQRNEGSPGTPKFTGVNELLTAGGEEFNVPGGLTAARQVDWDNDGVKDLICGGFKGGVYFYRNSGANDAPAFEAPVLLVDTGTNPSNGPYLPTSGIYVDPVDYDGDGKLDLLVGGYADWQPEGRPLTEAETARVEELKASMSEVEAKMAEISEVVQEQVAELTDPDEIRAAYEKLWEQPEYVTLTTQWQEQRKELSELVPPMKRESGVWIYRRSS